MLKLKELSELPTPRHLLDENDDLEEKDAGFLLQYTSWTTVDVTTSGAINTLVVAAPRFGMFCEALGGQKIGTVSSGTTKHPSEQQQQSSAASELYEYQPEQTTTESVEVLHETDVRYLSESEIATIHAPLLDPRDCHAFTAEVLSKLQPKRVVLLCASNMTSTVPQQVYSLQNSSCSLSLNLPNLPPPFVVSGTIASVLSNCERKSIPAAAVVVKGEGPEGHECVDFEAVTGPALQALEGVLQVSNLKVKRDHDTTMYI